MDEVLIRAGIFQGVEPYAAEALAYLDESQAAAPLAQAARDEPAFRAYALAAPSS